MAREALQQLIANIFSLKQNMEEEEPNLAQSHFHAQHKNSHTERIYNGALSTLGCLSGYH